MAGLRTGSETWPPRSLLQRHPEAPAPPWQSFHLWEGKHGGVSRQGSEPPLCSASPLLSPDRLTCNAQGEVLAATGLAKGIVGTAGVEATMLRAGRP